MDFNHTQKVLDLMDRLNAFMDEHIYPNEEAYREHFKTTDNLWKSPPLMDELKEEAKKYTVLLGYNYQSSDWYEKSYKILNSNYEKPKIKKDLEKQKSLLKKFKDLFK